MPRQETGVELTAGFAPAVAVIAVSVMPVSPGCHGTPHRASTVKEPPLIRGVLVKS